jgi:hypothetical protein
MRKKDDTIITNEYLDSLNFGSNPENTILNISLAYRVKNCICLFYNEPFAGSWLIGHGYMYDGKYYATTFRWITKKEDLVKIYESIIGKSITETPFRSNL